MLWWSSGPGSPGGPGGQGGAGGLVVQMVRWSRWSRWSRLGRWPTGHGVDHKGTVMNHFLVLEAILAM